MARTVASSAIRPSRQVLGEQRRPRRLVLDAERAHGAIRTALKPGKRQLIDWLATKEARPQRLDRRHQLGGALDLAASAGPPRARAKAATRSRTRLAFRRRPSKSATFPARFDILARASRLRPPIMRVVSSTIVARTLSQWTQGG